MIQDLKLFRKVLELLAFRWKEKDISTWNEAYILSEKSKEFVVFLYPTICDDVEHPEGKDLSGYYPS